MANIVAAHAKEAAKRRTKLEAEDILEKSEDELAVEKWMEEKKTTKKELAGYESGEKLETSIKLAEKIVETLGASFLLPTTVALMKECQVLRKSMRKTSSGAVRMIGQMLMEIAPMWVFALAVGLVGPAGWAEFDRYLLSGLIATAAINPDGTWDSAKSQRLAMNLVLIVVMWMLSDMASNRLLEHAKLQFTKKLKLRFMETLMYQDFEYFEKHGAGSLRHRLNSDVDAVSSSLLRLPRDFIVHNWRLSMQILMCFRLAPFDVVMVALSPLPFIAYGNRKLLNYSKKAGERGRKVQEHAMSGGCSEATGEPAMEWALKNGCATKTDVPYQAWTLPPSTAAGKEDWEDDDIRESHQTFAKLKNLSTTLMRCTSGEATMEAMVNSLVHMKLNGFTVAGGHSGTITGPLGQAFTFPSPMFLPPRAKVCSTSALSHYYFQAIEVVGSLVGIMAVCRDAHVDVLDTVESHVGITIAVAACCFPLASGCILYSATTISNKRLQPFLIRELESKNVDEDIMTMLRAYRLQGEMKSSMPDESKVSAGGEAQEHNTCDMSGQVELEPDDWAATLVIAASPVSATPSSLVITSKERTLEEVIEHRESESLS